MVKEHKSKFLVCVNEKEHSSTALRFACTKAKWRKNAVDMLYVIDPIDYNTVFSVGDKIKEDRRADAEKLLTKMAGEALEWSDINPTAIIREGRIAEEIIACIEADHDINLLVVGTAADGSSGKGGLLTQLTAEIGDKYHIPLLIVPGNLTDQQIEELN